MNCGMTRVQCQATFRSKIKLISCACMEEMIERLLFEEWGVSVDIYTDGVWNDVQLPEVKS